MTNINIDNSNPFASSEPSVEVVSSTSNELIVNVVIPSPTITEIEQNGTVYQLFNLPYTGNSSEVGKPTLPTLSEFLTIPQGADIQIEILNANVDETISNVLLYPTQLPLPDGGDLVPIEPPEFIIDEDFYDQDITYPNTLVTLDDVKSLRGVSVTTAHFFPYQYNPANLELTTYESFQVRFSLEGDYDFADSVKNSDRADSFENLYSSLLLNYDQLGQPQPDVPDTDEPTGARFLIITHPNFVEVANDLADWRNSQGLSTIVRTTNETGTTAQNIQNYIQNGYESWDIRPEFLLLLGDAEFVPTNYTADNHPWHGSPTGTDLYYTTVDGDDYYPDIHAGRIPVDSLAEAQNAIDNIINYERWPVTDPDFYDNITLAAYFQDNERNGFESRRFVRTSEEIRDYLVGEDYNVNRIYNTETNVTPTNYNDGRYANGEALPAELLRVNGFTWDGDAVDITDAINTGTLILNHRDHGAFWGWGDPRYTVTNVQGLTNADGLEDLTTNTDVTQKINHNLLPVVFSVNCQTGWFDNETDSASDDTGNDDIAFAEACLRNPNGGAVGVIAATRVSYSGHNDFMAEGFYDAIWPDFLNYGGTSQQPEYHLGAVLNYGKLAMENLWGDPWGLQQLEFEIFHYFGDPTTQIRTSIDPSNQAPTDIELTKQAVSGQLPIGTVLGHLNTIDPNSGDTFTYSLVPSDNDTDNDLFKVVGDQLQTNTDTLNTGDEWNFNILVRTEDSGGLACEKVISISKPKGIDWGDVHLVTFDGRHYDLQSFGEFILVESTVDDWVIQARQEAWEHPSGSLLDYVSVNTAFATEVDDHRVVFDMKLDPDNKLKIDGNITTLTSGQTLTIGNSQIQRQDHVYILTYAGADEILSTADDDQVIIGDNGDLGNYLNIEVFPSYGRVGLLQGLLGNADGLVSNDFTLRDGTQLSANPSIQQLHGEYADSWRITPEESLFVTPPPPSSYPSRLITLEDLDPQGVRAGQKLAIDAKIPEGDIADAVAFDLAVTHDLNFLQGAVELFAPDTPQATVNTAIQNNWANLLSFSTFPLTNLTGTDKADQLTGTADNEMFIGLGGRDLLTGGGGDDVFAYNNRAEGGDVITDFSEGDRIDLSKVLDEIGYTGTDALEDQYVRFIGRTNMTTVQIDVDGLGATRPRDFVLVQGVDIYMLSNPDNFIL